ncbi:hypothetical protein [Micromonospora sp. CPCC 206061]|uniref:hypothetical protein n=1 Tax=Micromonospora sp. CPCC 206061 TaxID=3122410 RepID=UPI002FEEF3E6
MAWIDIIDDNSRAKIDAKLTERGAEHLRYANGDREFAAFLLVADALAYKHFGLSIFDLPDYCWRDAYDDEMTPAQALHVALEAGI